MKIIHSHPTGNANSRNAAKAFADSQILDSFYTTIGVYEGAFLDGISNIKYLTELKKRYYDSVLKPYTKTMPFYELVRLLSKKFGITFLIEHDKGYFCIDQVYRKLDERIANSLFDHKKNGATAIYAYEDGAYESFRRAKELGLKCCYELPSVHWRKVHDLLKPEYEKHTQWRNTINVFNDTEEKLRRKDSELLMADRIFVPSSFMLQTLNSFPISDLITKTKVIPYGFPDVCSSVLKSEVPKNKQIKFLFVGNLSIQKGIVNLFDAIKGLSKYIELTIVGAMPHKKCVTLEKELRNHNYLGALSNSDVLKIMRKHDVLVFPTLSDSFGLVISEAMSQGLPVLTTERSAGPDFIESGVNGWLFEAGNTDSLKLKIEYLIKHPNVIKEVSLKAIGTAKRRPWSVYRKELIETIIDD